MCGAVRVCNFRGRSSLVQLAARRKPLRIIHLDLVVGKSVTFSAMLSDSPITIAQSGPFHISVLPGPHGRFVVDDHRRGQVVMARTSGASRTY